MNEKDLQQLRFPIGTFEAPEAFDPQQLEIFILNIQSFPALLRREVESLSEDQLNTSYRPGGWTLRQVVHHCADSHMNGFIRHRLCITEENPVIKPYMEDRFAMQQDYLLTPIENSLTLLEKLHERWNIFLRALPQETMHKTYIHPEYGRTYSLYTSIANYEWHGRHHLAHITQTKQLKGWN